MKPGAYNPDQSTFWWAALPACPSALQDSGRDCKIREADSCFAILRSLNVYGLDGLFGKTSPVSCRAAEDGTLVPSSGRWATSGMGGPTGCWTHSMCEHTGIHAPSRSDGDVCSLWDVLEQADVPQKYYLSARACAGILRRAKRRGKALPEMLRVALYLGASAPSGRKAAGQPATKHIT